MNLLIRYFISLCLLLLSITTFYFLYKYLKKYQGKEISIGDVEIGVGILLVSLLELLLGILYFLDGTTLEHMYKEPLFLVPLLLVGGYFVLGLLLNYQEKKNGLIDKKRKLNFNDKKINS